MYLSNETRKRKEYFNEERKSCFIADSEFSESIKSLYNVLFNTTYKYEVQSQKDLCLFTHDELQKVFNEELGRGARDIKYYVRLVKRYYSWCSEHGLETHEEALDNIVIDNTQKIRREMVSSPGHLQMVLDKVFDPIEDETSDCILRCYIWILFSGIYGEDSTEILTKDVDIQHMVINHNGSSYPIYREALSTFRSACELPDFMYIHPLYKVKGDRRKRLDSPYLLRGVRSEKPGFLSFRNNITRVFREHDIGLTLRAVYDSGKFYRVFEQERAGVKARPLFEKRSDYNNYLMWKKAFDC